MRIFTASKIKMEWNSLDKHIVVEHWNDLSVVSNALIRNLLKESCAAILQEFNAALARAYQQARSMSDQ
jgi:hypothetical protein